MPFKMNHQRELFKNNFQDSRNVSVFSLTLILSTCLFMFHIVCFTPFASSSHPFAARFLQFNIRFNVILPKTMSCIVNLLFSLIRAGNWLKMRAKQNAIMDCIHQPFREEKKKKETVTFMVKTKRIKMGYETHCDSGVCVRQLN